MKVIDRKATIEAVRYLFDKELPQIMLMGNWRYFDVLYSEIPEYNYGESEPLELITNSSQAKEALYLIIGAIKCLSDRELDVLKIRYLECLSWNEYEKITGYTAGRGLQLARQAFYNFALMTVDSLNLIVEVDNG